jgi:hypothetical protein
MTHMRRGLLLAVLAPVMAVGLTSCYPGSEDNASDFDVVVTLYDADAAFASISSFSMPDSVAKLGDGDVSYRFDDTILATLRTNLLALGWEEKPYDDANDVPDVVVLPGVTATDWQAYVPGGGWWGYWPPYWGPGWGVWYPWCCGGYTYSYSTGSVVLNMLSTEEADDEQQRAPSIWVAVGNGYAGLNSDRARVQKAVNDAFRQSPYLGGNTNLPTQ